MKRFAGALPLILMLHQNATAANIGRLFFSPEQRVQLEREHMRQAVATNRAHSSPVLSGIVQKNGGPRTIWIDGIPQEAESSSKHAPESQPVTLPGKTHPVLLKVGQRLSP